MPITRQNSAAGVPLDIPRHIKKEKLSPTVLKLKADFRLRFSKEPSGPLRNKESWLRKKLDATALVVAQGDSPAGESPAGELPAPSEALPNKIAEIDARLETCPVQLQPELLEERALRIKNYKISKTMNRKSRTVKELLRQVKGKSRALAESRLPYNERKETHLGKAIVNAIAPFAKEEDFVTNVNTTIDVLLKYRVASIEATAVKGKLKLEQQEHGVMEQEFADRLRKADELAASVAGRIQHADLVMPKPKGRKRMRRLSTLTLACDDDEAFSSEADANQAAAAYQSNLSAGQAAASQSLAWEGDGGSGEEN